MTEKAQFTRDDVVRAEALRAEVAALRDEANAKAAAAKAAGKTRTPAGVYGLRQKADALWQEANALAPQPVDPTELLALTLRNMADSAERFRARRDEFVKNATTPSGVKAAVEWETDDLIIAAFDAEWTKIALDRFEHNKANTNMDDLASIVEAITVVINTLEREVADYTPNHSTNPMANAISEWKVLARQTWLRNGRFAREWIRHCQDGIGAWRLLNETE